MRRNLGAFSRNAPSKVAGLRKIREEIAKIIPGCTRLRMREYQGEQWVYHKDSGVLLHKADAHDLLTVPRE